MQKWFHESKVRVFCVYRKLMIANHFLSKLVSQIETPLYKIEYSLSALQEKVAQFKRETKIQSKLRNEVFKPDETDVGKQSHRKNVLEKNNVISVYFNKSPDSNEESFDVITNWNDKEQSDDKNKTILEENALPFDLEQTVFLRHSIIHSEDPLYTNIRLYEVIKKSIEIISEDEHFSDDHRTEHKKVQRRKPNESVEVPFPDNLYRTQQRLPTQLVYFANKYKKIVRESTMNQHSTGSFTENKHYCKIIQLSQSYHTMTQPNDAISFLSQDAMVDDNEHSHFTKTASAPMNTSSQMAGPMLKSCVSERLQIRKISFDDSRNAALANRVDESCQPSQSRICCPRIAPTQINLTPKMCPAARTFLERELQEEKSIFEEAKRRTDEERRRMNQEKKKFKDQIKRNKSPQCGIKTCPNKLRDKTPLKIKPCCNENSCSNLQKLETKTTNRAPFYEKDSVSTVSDSLESKFSQEITKFTVEKPTPKSTDCLSNIEKSLVDQIRLLAKNRKVDELEDITDEEKSLIKDIRLLAKKQTFQVSGDITSNTEKCIIEQIRKLATNQTLQTPQNGVDVEESTQTSEKSNPKGVINETCPCLNKTNVPDITEAEKILINQIKVLAEELTQIVSKNISNSESAAKSVTPKQLPNVTRGIKINTIQTTVSDTDPKPKITQEGKTSKETTINTEKSLLEQIKVLATNLTLKILEDETKNSRSDEKEIGIELNKSSEITNLEKMLVENIKKLAKDLTLTKSNSKNTTKPQISEQQQNISQLEKQTLNASYDKFNVKQLKIEQIKVPTKKTIPEYVIEENTCTLASTGNLKNNKKQKIEHITIQNGDDERGKGKRKTEHSRTIEISKRTVVGKTIAVYKTIMPNLEVQNDKDDECSTISENTSNILGTSIVPPNTSSTSQVGCNEGTCKFANQEPNKPTDKNYLSNMVSGNTSTADDLSLILRKATEYKFQTTNKNGLNASASFEITHTEIINKEKYRQNENQRFGNASKSCTVIDDIRNPQDICKTKADQLNLKDSNVTLNISGKCTSTSSLNRIHKHYCPKYLRSNFTDETLQCHRIKSKDDCCGGSKSFKTTEFGTTEHISTKMSTHRGEFIKKEIRMHNVLNNTSSNKELIRKQIDIKYSEIKVPNNSVNEINEANLKKIEPPTKSSNTNVCKKKAPITNTATSYNNLDYKLSISLKPLDEPRNVKTENGTSVTDVARLRITLKRDKTPPPSANVHSSACCTDLTYFLKRNGNKLTTFRAPCMRDNSEVEVYTCVSKASCENRNCEEEEEIIVVADASVDATVPIKGSSKTQIYGRRPKPHSCLQTIVTPIKKFNISTYVDNDAEVVSANTSVSNLKPAKPIKSTCTPKSVSKDTLSVTSEFSRRSSCCIVKIVPKKQKQKPEEDAKLILNLIESLKSLVAAQNGKKEKLKGKERKAKKERILRSAQDKEKDLEIKIYKPGKRKPTRSASGSTYCSCNMSSSSDSVACCVNIKTVSNSASEDVIKFETKQSSCTNTPKQTKSFTNKSDASTTTHRRGRYYLLSRSKSSGSRNHTAIDSKSINFDCDTEICNKINNKKNKNKSKCHESKNSSPNKKCKVCRSKTKTKETKSHHKRHHKNEK